MVSVDSPLSPAELDAGTTVLVVGPAMTRKRDVMYDLLAGGPDDSAIVASTKADRRRVRRALVDKRGLDTVSVVDCVSQGGFGGPAEDEHTRYVSTPADLTGLGIAVSGFMQDCFHDPNRRETRVGLHTLSTLLMYADLRRVYQFVHVLTTRIQSAGFTGAFALDTAAGDAETRERLFQPFDALVETRETDVGPQLRVRGGDFGPRDWTALD